VTITDKNGCELVKEYTVAEEDPLQLSVTFSNANCPSDTDGSIDLTVSGGTVLNPVNPWLYYFDWDNDGVDTPPATDTEDLTGVLGPGLYTVIVTDSNGCTATISATIGFNNPIHILIGIGEIELFIC